MTAKIPIFFLCALVFVIFIANETLADKADNLTRKEIEIKPIMISTLPTELIFPMFGLLKFGIKLPKLKLPKPPKMPLKIKPKPPKKPPTNIAKPKPPQKPSGGENTAPKPTKKPSTNNGKPKPTNKPSGNKKVEKKKEKQQRKKENRNYDDEESTVEDEESTEDEQATESEEISQQLLQELEKLTNNYFQSALI